MSEYYGVTTPTEDFISHFGIMGMRWGVRKKRELNSTPKQTYTPPKENDKTRALWSKIEKMESDFYKNEELVDKHRKGCAKELATKWIKEDPHHQYFKDYKDAYGRAYNGYKYGDLDQGSSSSFEHYTRTNQKAGQRYRALNKAYAQEYRRLNPL